MNRNRTIRKIRKPVLLLGLVLSLTAAAACSKGQTTTNSQATGTPAAETSAAQPRTITDAAGKQVQIPAKVERIGDSWHAHNELDIMLGAGDKIVATVHSPKSKPWMYKVNPAMNSALTTFGADFNVEALLAVKPDVMFMLKGDKNAEKIASTGIPVVELSFTDFPSMKKTISLTAEVLGPEAVIRADQYNAYLDGKLKAIRDITDGIPKEQRPKVLHVTNLSPLTVDGNDTIIQDWIETAGGINAASSLSGFNKEVSIEQVLQWNPDFIIVGSTAFSSSGKSLSLMKEDEAWKKTRAIQNNNLFINPEGAFNWDRYGAEEALQIQWAAKILHPELFQHIDIVKETKSFYKEFLYYELTDDDVQKILNAKPPA